METARMEVGPAGNDIGLVRREVGTARKKANKQTNQNFGAEGALYYQRCFVNTLCIVL